MSKRKRIAIITAWFPPISSVATLRMKAFHEFLSDEFDIDVFTLGEDSVEILSKNNSIYRKPSAKLFSLTDSKRSDSRISHLFKTTVKVILLKLKFNKMNIWKKGIQKLIFQLHGVKPYDFIISSYSPEEAHEVAISLKKKYPNLIWLADCRDELSQNAQLAKHSLNKIIKVEKLINEYANAISTVSEPILDDFRKICPKVKDFLLVRNGFNHDFVNLNKGKKVNEVFTIGYYGTFYDRNKPNLLFNILLELEKELKGFDFRIKFVGSYRNFKIPNEIKEKLAIEPFLQYAQAIEDMSKMDALLFQYTYANKIGVYSGKIFDYISVQRPVIGFVHPNIVAAKLIMDTNSGYVADFDNKENCKKIVLRAYEDWLKNECPFASHNDVRELHRKFQVERIATYFRGIEN